jgi:predicted GNAT superfamily acetyltransferase
LHGSLPTDRLVAEWHLRSDRVLKVLAGKQANAPKSKRTVRITISPGVEDLRSSDLSRARQVQSDVRAEFLKWLGQGYAATAVAPSKGGMDYILEPGSSR